MAQIGAFVCSKSAPSAIAAPPEAAMHSPSSANPRCCCRLHAPHAQRPLRRYFKHIASHSQPHVMHGGHRQRLACTCSPGAGSLAGAEMLWMILSCPSAQLWHWNTSIALMRCMRSDADSWASGQGAGMANAALAYSNFTVLQPEASKSSWRVLDVLAALALALA